MLGIIDVEQLGIAVLSSQALGLPSRPAEECANCAAYRIGPEADGNLRVDPEIHLPSPGMDVDIAYFYNANTGILNPASNALYGYGRTISTQLTAQASGNPAATYVTLTRGNGSVANYQLSGVSYQPVTSDLLNTLTTLTDGGNAYWKEATLDGHSAFYPYDTAAKLTSIVYAADAVGNRHTYLYDGSQKLQNVQDAVGRLVTYNYVSGGTYAGMLESIQDWAGRFTSFQYLTVASNPVLATVVGPSGCQTGYGYSSINSVPVLDRITDPNGYSTTYAYDVSGRVYQRTVAGLYTSLYTYSNGQMVAQDATGVVVTQSLYTDYKLRSVADATGNLTTLSRNAKGQETSRQDLLGAIWTTTYDSYGNPQTKVDPYGFVTTISHDAYNNPTTIQYADGSITTMVWGYGGSSFDTTGAKRRLQATIDQLGQATSYAYNGRGQLLEVWNALDQRTTYNYDAFGNLESVANPLDQRVTNSYDLAGNVIARTNPLGYRTTTAYDAQNRPVSMTDALGFITTLAYDGVGNLLVRIDALGNRTSTTYNVFDQPSSMQDALGFVTSFAYDGAGRMLGVTDPLGRINTNLYDAAGRAIGSMDALGRINSTVYDLLGRPWASVDALGNRTTTAYDLAGRPVTFMDALGFISTAVYDRLGRSVASVDALGRRSTTTYDLVGRPVTFMDALGYITTSVYDVLGRSVASVDQLGFTSTTVYDLAGRLSATYDALGYRTSYVYDAAGRQLATIDATGFRVTNAYDGRGSLKSVQQFNTQLTTFSYDAVGRQIEVLNAVGYTTTSVYDAVGRSVGTIDALGNRTTTLYDSAGQAIASVNQLGRPTTSVYDAVGQMIAEQNQLGYITTLSYDAVGRLTTLLNANARMTTMLYDARGSLLVNEDALGSQTLYAYDAVGNQINRTDGRGQITTYSYDALDRMATVAYTGGKMVTHQYDARGLESAWRDSSGLYTMSYDALGRLSNLQDSSGAILTNTYDAISRRLSLVELDNQRTTYTYTAGSLGTSQRQFYIDGPGGVSLYDLLDGLGRSYRINITSSTPDFRQEEGYDRAGRHISHSIYQILPTIDIEDYTGTLDRAGNFTRITELDGTRTSYTYDRANQLLSEWRGGVNSYRATYTYDPLGNRLTQVNVGDVRTTYVYDAANQLSSEQTGNATINYSYDLNGNQILKDEGAGVLTTMVWDEENRLTNVAYPGGALSTYVYSADGLRRKREEGNQSLLQVWDGTQLLQEKNATNGAEVTRYLLQNSSYSGLRAQRHASDNTWRFFGYDLQGNTRLLINSDGSSNLSLLYRAFGQKQATSGAGSTLMQFGAMWGYEWDADSQMWVKARHLSGTQGRWLSQDPIGFAGGDWNLFRYVGNKPTVKSDCRGLMYPEGYTQPRPQRPTPVAPTPTPNPFSTGRGCGSNIGIARNAVKRVCDLIKFRQPCIAQCLAQNGFRGRWGCMNNWCNSPQFICPRRGSGGNCDEATQFSCIQAWSMEGSGPGCVIRLCPDFFTQRCAIANSSTPRPQAGRVEDILHELNHCCAPRGETDLTGDYDRDEWANKTHRYYNDMTKCILEKCNCPSWVRY